MQISLQSNPGFKAGCKSNSPATIPPWRSGCSEMLEDNQKAKKAIQQQLEKMGTAIPESVIEGYLQKVNTNLEKNGFRGNDLDDMTARSRFIKNVVLQKPERYAQQAIEYNENLQKKLNIKG